MRGGVRATGVRVEGFIIGINPNLEPALDGLTIDTASAVTIPPTPDGRGGSTVRRHHRPGPPGLGPGPEPGQLEVVRPAQQAEVEQSDLAECDTALGTDDGVAWGA